MHAAVRAILAANEHRAWHSRDLVGRLHALQDGELLAQAWRRGRRRDTATVSGRLARRPAGAGGLVQAALWRYRARQGAHRTAAQDGPVTPL